MKAESVNSFFQATKDVFQLMLDIGIEQGKLGMVENMIPSKDANVVLGVTGDLSGTILFSFPQKMILEMVKIMCGMEMDEIDSFVSSALGEVANIIGGNAATMLAANNYKCDIVPPQIFVGEYKSFSMANEKALLLPLKTSIGEFDINIFLKEK
ncbi:chemotaxis protein CheX [Clostridium formicaceticum]|uniref:CheY-P phosphatase CheX n=1 Tax=Clostridium formicaceticum TaxID=1497 RepID=A0AAC9RJY8_9CLOT|nr:chemotaxis protein CheX [Clostridium formicaceticum]AOY76590.1 chemotaxis protein CheX [Clostridium formicaceticum]ARE87009.1 CheY-P phosphatase CheX [Clostridium formicaceticum]